MNNEQIIICNEIPKIGEIYWSTGVFDPIETLSTDSNTVIKKDRPVLVISKKHDNKNVRCVVLPLTSSSSCMFEGNKYILDKYFRNENLQACYYANLLAFRNIPNITVYQIKKQLEKDFGKSVSLAGYKYNPEHYLFMECYRQEEYEEDLFKCKTKEEEMAELEAERRARIEPIDFNAVKSRFCASSTIIIASSNERPRRNAIGHTSIWCINSFTWL